MAQISRSTKINGGTTLTSSTLARATDVETDSLTLFNAHNNHDTGTSKWQVVSVLGATSVPLVADNSTGTQDIADLKANGVTKVAVDATGHIQAADGTQGLPEYSFASGNTNGLYMAGTNNPAISVSGTKRLDISTTAVTLALPLAMGSNKITGLTNGSAASDAAAFGQIPTHNDAATYTPTIGGAGTVSTTNMFWSQDGKMIHIWGTFLAGTVAASTASITVPVTKTIDTTKVVNGSPLGDCFDMATGTVTASVHSLGFSDASDTSKIFFSKSFATGALLTSALGNAIWDTGAYIYINIFVPVTA